MSGSERIRVLIAKGRPSGRQGLESMLQTQPDIEVVGQAAGGDEVARQALRTRPDVIVLDVRRPATDGLGALVEITRALAGTGWLMLIGFNDPARVLRAIRAVHRGEGALDPVPTQQPTGASEAFPGAAHGVDDLSPSELRVLTLLTQGMSNRQLATTLCASERTVSTHIRQILDKLGMETREQAALYAREHGLADIGPSGSADQQPARRPGGSAGGTRLYSVRQHTTA